MKHVKVGLLLLVFTALLVSPFVPITDSMTSNEEVHKTSPTSVLSYTSHAPISIIGDDELNTTAHNEGWTGDGSSESPFLIQGYEITPSEELIRIRNTRYHFKIIDCNFTGAIFAVNLGNATNGVVENCLFWSNGCGIFLNNVTGIDVVGCIFSPTSSGSDCIVIDEAIDCYISSCIMQGVTNSDTGIYGEDSDAITLYNNTVSEFDNHGIFFAASTEINITDNTVYHNEGTGMGPSCGIYLVEGILAHIEGNNITENSDNGITIDGFFNVTVVDNHITDNWIHGISVAWADYVVIEDNYIEGHGDGIIEGPVCGVTTYFSDYVQIIDNEFWWNALNSITVGYSEDVYVFNNYINHSYSHGIEVYYSPNATVQANEIYNSYGYESGPACGIYMRYSNDTQVLDNILDYNSENGIYVENSHHGELHANRISYSEMNGIFMDYATEWYISHNIIYDNGGPGIYLNDQADDNYLWYNDVGWSGEFLVGDEGDNQWNYTGVGNWYSDYDGADTYAIFGGAIDYSPSVSLYSGVTTPGEYEFGTTGNTMTWNSSALNPGGYELLIDDVSQGLETWDGSAIAADVDGLAVGVYNVTLIVYHISGHWLTNQSVLTVVDTEAPTWTVTPQDQTLDYNEALSYQLQASDPSGIASWAVNNTANFTISSGGLLTNATFLESGVYYVEVTVTDVYAHAASVTIMITVNEIPTPTPTTTTTTTTTGQPLDPLILLAVGGAGAGVVIVVIVIIIKKKGT